ncbi:hypothetical protein ONZ45_g17476 [Pleurotus djamor]|nr:hypothetical protein ONZ45_g17476 [Pleurotus djamor]
MRRPLQELPLEQYLPASSKSSCRPNKRPLSPGAPNLFSPTKRRILEEEGIFSMEKTKKSPFPPSRLKGPDYFSAALCGPESPVRRLDFSPSKPATSEEWIRSQGDAKNPSSLAKHVSSSSLPTASSSSTPFEEFEDESGDFAIDSSSTPPHSYIPRMIPREMPPPQDVQSLHYPGFDIYQDTHIILPSAADSMRPVPNGLAAEETENVPPRRKVKKSVTVPLSPGSGELKKLDLGAHAKARSVPMTPKTVVVSKIRLPSPTPRRAPLTLSPLSSATPKVHAGTRKELRRMLEEEVDDADGHDDLDS